MANDNETTKKRSNEEEEAADNQRNDIQSKKIKESIPTLGINTILEDITYLEKLKNSWAVENYDSVESPSIKFATFPFPHGEICDVLMDPSVLIDLQKLLQYEEKSSDLFHFRQSSDLSNMTTASVGYESIKAICNFLETKLFDVIKLITGLPLNGKFDAFASLYQQKDHLLCHDDELDERRIAFIIYMSEEWQNDYGGTLDLFDFIENDNGIEPGIINKSILPLFNKLAFFEVSAKSFHQVREVLSDTASRWAISGWYYGEPLPRPHVQLPEEPFTVVDFPERGEAPLAKNLDSTYLDTETMKTVNQKLSENSEILLSKFLQPSLYQLILKNLSTIKDSQWTSAGPANLQNFLQLRDTDSAFPQESLEFFNSKEFLEFLQDLTEFPFASEPELRFSCSLKKFVHGSYTLIRGKERHYQKPTDEHDCSVEIISDDEESEDVCNDNENIPQSSINGLCNESANNDNNSDVEVIEDDGEDEDGFEIIQDISDDSDDEETPEPNRIDVMYFIIPDDIDQNSEHNGTAEVEDETEKKNDELLANETNGERDVNWEESWGGNRIYTDGKTGQQLIVVTPTGNALAIIVRDDAINSHFSYVNCLAKNHIFYCYDFEFNFPQTMDK